jgi:WD40 repeat protein
MATEKVQKKDKDDEDERLDLLRECLADPKKKKVKIGHSARIFCCRAHVFPKRKKKKREEEEAAEQQPTTATPASKKEELRDWCDRLFVATCGEDKTVRIWWSNKLKLLHTLLGHQEEVLSVEWSRQGTFLASCAADNMVHLWKIDVATIHDTAPTIVARLRHEDHVYRAVFANRPLDPSSWSFGEREGDGAKTETTTATREEMEAEREESDSDDSGCKLFTCSNNKVFCWDLSSEDCLLVKTLDRKGIRYGGERNTQALAFIFDMSLDATNRVAVALSDGTVRILTFSRNEEKEQVLGKLDSPVTCLKWIDSNKEEDDNEHLLSVCCADGKIHLIDMVESLRKAQLVSRRSWQAHDGTIFGCLPISARTILTCSGDQSVKLWDLGFKSTETDTDTECPPRLISAISEPDYPFHSVDFAMNGQGSVMLFLAGGRSGILGTPFFYRTVFDF